MKLPAHPLAILAACSALSFGADYSWRPVTIGGGGFVTGVEFHPSQSGLAYARTDVGGAYRRDTAGGKWIALNDAVGGLNNEFMNLGVLSIGLDPADSNRVYLACGQYVQSWAPAARFMSSTDRGVTWMDTALPFKLGGNQNGRGTGERLAVDPHDGARLFLGTNADGLWRSTDRGANWVRLANFTPIETTFVRCDPDNANTLYAGAVLSAGDTLWKSTDGGNTWAAVPGQPSGLFALQTSFDAAGTLHITFSNAIGPNGATAGAVWKLDTTGTWTNLNLPGGQGGFSGVSVDPNLPGRLVVSTLNRWYPRDEIYRSNDGGLTWTGILDGANLDRSSAPWSASLTPHWIGDVEIDPFDSNRASFITGFGVFSTVNLGVASGKPTWIFDNAGLEETVPLALVSPASGAPLVSVIGDFDGFRHDNVDASPALGRHSPHKGTTHSLDGAGTAPAVLAKMHNATGAISRDGGTTWTDFPTAPATATNERGQIVVSADGARLLWCPDESVAYFSADDGATWTPSTGSPTGTLWPAADRVNPLRFTVYDPATRAVHISTDGGATFVAGDTNLPSGGRRIEAVPGQAGNLWHTAWNGGLWRSTDGGADFIQVSTVERGYQVGFGRSPDGTGHPSVFLWGRVGGADGLYRSDDTGATWQRINDGRHQFGYINDLTGDPRVHGRVYLATSGRGVIVGEEVIEPRFTEMIYENGLAAGWNNWSWATVGMTSASPVRRGTAAVSVTAGGYQALYLRRTALMDTTGFSAIAFWIHGGTAGGQSLKAFGLRNGAAQTEKILAAPLAGAWSKVVIPLSELGVSDVNDFNGVWIQSRIGTAQAAFHVDDVALVGAADAAVWTPLDWESWRQSVFTIAQLANSSISGPDADPDYDGHANLVEWHLLGNPLANGGGLWGGFSVNGGSMSLGYTRRIGNTAGMVLEYATDLEDWHPATAWPSATSQATPLDAQGLREDIIWTLPLAGEDRCFLRLR